MKLDAVVALFPDLEVVELTAWIEQSWVRPERTEDEWAFGEIDVARIRLIYDLRHNLEMPEEALPVLLSLLDQVYDLRRKLNALDAALQDHPQDVRAALLPILRSDDLEN